MADRAHDWTDEQIEALQRKFDRAYAQAAREMREELDAYLADYDKANRRWKDMLRSGDATEEQYKGWLRSQSVRRDYLVDMTDTLSRDATRTNKLALDMVNDELPRVYAENANYAAYGIESHLRANTHAFDLVDQSTVRRMMGLPDDGQVMKEVTLDEDEVSPPLVTMRKLNLDEAKDVRWNRQRFNAALTQSILQGESIPDTAKRMSRVLNMGKNMATRAARTAMTSAENAGRVDSYLRAKGIGIELEQEWLATLDERTRTSHIELDGQHVPIGEKFKVPSSGNELEFPADPKAEPSEVWNCRCTLVAWFPEDAEESLEGRFSRLPDGMTYDEWKALKQAESAAEGQTEEQLEARVRELDDIVMLNTNLPTTYLEDDTYADYLQEWADELRGRMDEYSWAADLDEDELERESMRRYDEYDRKFAELTERQGKLGWNDPEYEAIDREKNRLLEWLDEIDDKIDAVRSYKRASSEYDDVFARLQSRLEQNRVERETALANRETLRQSILERNRAVAELSSAQGFAKQVRDALGDEFADSMERVIESARERHPEIADMYTKFSSQFKVSESGLSRTAHYNPSDFGIHFNAARDEVGSDWEPRYGTAFHEFGHLIDNLSRHRGYSSGRNGDGWGWSTRDAELTSVIKKDWTRFRNEQGKRLGVRRDKNEAVIRMLREEKRALGDDGDIVFSDVSDIIEGCTRVSYPLGAGHGASYHRSSDYYTGLEFFAETCAAAMTNERSYQQLRRIFPNAVDIVERIAREMF